MASNGNFALRVPASLMAELKIAAEREATSLNQFIVQAAAEKLTWLRARGYLDNGDAYLKQRAARAVPGRLRAFLDSAGNSEPPRPGGELPDGWPNNPGSEARPAKGARRRPRTPAQA
jgi:hypothetical protein